MGGMLEAKLLITAEDRTAAAFAAIEKRVASMNRAIAGQGRMAGLVSRMSSYVAGGDGHAGHGRAGLAVNSDLRALSSSLRVASADLRALAASARAVRLAAGGAGGGFGGGAAHGRAGGRGSHKGGMMQDGLAFAGGSLIGHHAHTMMFMGGAMVAGLAVHEAAKASGERAHERVRMNVSGMSAAETRAAELEAARITAAMPAIKQTEAMHMLRNARSIVGSYSEAAEIMEPLAKLRIVAQGARPGADVSEDFDQLVKGLEIKGVTQNPHKFRQYMEGIAKGLNVFGDTLKPYQYYEMFKYGRQATPMLSERFMLGTAPTLAQELGGSSYGNAVSGFNRAIVSGRMEHSALKELYRLGLVQKDDLDFLKTGEVKGMKPGRSVAGAHLAQTDPNEWVKQYFIPAMQKMGITGGEAMMKEVGTVFTNRMAAQLVGILTTQQPRINKDLALIDHAPGLDAAHTYATKDPTIAYAGLKGAIESLTATIGSGWAVALTPAMNGLSKALAGYNARLLQAQEDRKDGKRPEGEKSLQRLFNKALTGVDSDQPLSEITRQERLNADYEARRKQLVASRGAKGDTPEPNWNVVDWGLRHPGEAFPGNRHPLRGGNAHRDFVDKEIADLDALHTARLRAERDLVAHSDRQQLIARFSNPSRFDAPKVTPPIANIGEHDAPFMTRFGDPLRGAPGWRSFDAKGDPRAYGPFPQAAGAPPAASPALPDLAGLLAGKIEAHANVEGTATVNVTVTVNAGSDLIKAAGDAKTATQMALKSAGSGGGKTPTGNSMPEANPTGKSGGGR